MKAMYKVLGEIHVKDGAGTDAVAYRVGQVVEMDIETGDNYVEQGLAERVDGEEAVDTSEAPVEEAPVTDETPAPTQSDEDAVLGVDLAKEGGDTHVEVEHATYRITDVVTLVKDGEEYSPEIDEEVSLPVEIGDQLVADGQAEKIEA